VENQYLDGRAVMNCGQETASQVDQEVMRILNECYEKAIELLSAHRETMDKLAEHLVEKETITGKEFMEIYHRERGDLEETEQEKEELAEEQKPVDTVEVQPVQEVSIEETVPVAEEADSKLDC